MNADNKDGRPKYHDFYLWHLVKLNLVQEIDAETTENTPASNGTSSSSYRPIGDYWKKAARNDPVTVAIIDTGVDVFHPNLEENCLVQVDFGPSAHGVVYLPPLKSLRRLEALGADFGKVAPSEQRTLLTAAANELKDLCCQQGIDADQTMRVLRRLGKTSDASEKDQIRDDELPALANDLLRASQAGKVRPYAAMTEKSKGTDESSNCEDGQARKRPPPSLPDIDKFEDNLSPEALDVLQKLLGQVHDREVLELDDPSTFFGSHATSCAGLIAGHPPKRTQTESPRPGPIPYYGVNPWAKILPIATPYSHELLPVLRALLWAYARDAQIIFMPRALPDPVARMEVMKGSPYTTRIDAEPDKDKSDNPRPGDQAVYDRLRIHKEILEALLKFISAKRYVILAAGNDGMANGLSYPTNLILEEGFENLIVVGAKNKADEYSAYTNGYGDNLSGKLFWMLSDDAEALDETRFSINEKSFYGADYDYTSLVREMKNTFNPWSILALDVRGSYGRTARPGPEEPIGDRGHDASSLYTLFSGTSAASSLFAGLTSLLIQTGEVEVPPDLGELRKSIKTFYSNV